MTHTELLAVQTASSKIYESIAILRLGAPRNDIPLELLKHAAELLDKIVKGHATKD